MPLTPLQGPGHVPRISWAPSRILRGGGHTELALVRTESTHSLWPREGESAGQ